MRWLGAISALWIAAAGLPAGGDAAAFPHGLARRGCTQEDAPALEVFLTHVAWDGKGEPPKPYLHIEIAWADFDRLVGKDLELIPLSRHGVDPARHVVRAEAAGEHGDAAWLSGRLRLTKVEVDKRVEGSYHFTAPDKKVWTGEFKVGWTAGRAACG